MSALDGHSGSLGKNDGMVIAIPWSTAWGQQFFVDDSSYQVHHRFMSSGTWQNWVQFLDTSNYNSFAPTLTGGGASGTWGINITGTATYATYIKCPDTRNTVLNPQDLTASSMGVRFDFKHKDITNLTDASYSGVMSFRPYSSASDWSGGPAHQLAFNEVGLYRRQSTGNTTWGNWFKLLDSNNYNSYAPKLDGTGATGSWNIRVAGAKITTTTNALAKYSNTTGTFADSSVLVDSCSFIRLNGVALTQGGTWFGMRYADNDNPESRRHPPAKFFL